MKFELVEEQRKSALLQVQSKQIQFGMLSQENNGGINDEVTLNGFDNDGVIIDNNDTKEVIKKLHHERKKSEQLKNQLDVLQYQYADEKLDNMNKEEELKVFFCANC